MPAVETAGHDLLEMQACGDVMYAKPKPELHTACRMSIGGEYDR